MFFGIFTRFRRSSGMIADDAVDRRKLGKLNYRSIPGLT